MAKRFKEMPKLVGHKTSTKERGASKNDSCVSFADQRYFRGRFQTSTPASSTYASLEPKFDDVSVFHESDSDVETVKSKLPLSSQSQQVTDQSLCVDIAHARYVQALYLDVMMKNYISQHRKDETTYLTQLSLLVSNLSDHLAYLERMTMAAKHQKEVQEVIMRQETCLNKVKIALESSMEPFKKLMNAIENMRHNMQFEGICLDQEELNDLSVVLDKADLVLQQLIQMFSSCNLVKSAQSYHDLETSLQKGIDLLKQCRQHIHLLENSVIEASTVKIQMLHKRKPNKLD